MRFCTLPIGDSGWGLSFWIDGGELSLQLIPPSGAKHDPSPRSIGDAVDTAMPEAGPTDKLRADYRIAKSALQFLQSHLDREETRALTLSTEGS